VSVFIAIVRKYERIIDEAVDRAYEAGYERGRRVGRIEAIGGRVDRDALALSEGNAVNDESNENNSAESTGETETDKTGNYPSGSSNRSTPQ
jgi:hypothetical protein